MADTRELSLPLRMFLAAYPWRRIDPVPRAALRRPLQEARIALVTSGGFVEPGQEDFDYRVKGGDVSYREIGAGTPVQSLTESHRSDSFDHAGIQSDPNLAFPLDRLRELVASRRIGEMNRRHFSVMGSITAPARLTATAADIASKVVEDAVDAVLLVPV